MTRRVRRWVAAAVAVATGLMAGLAATTGVNQCWSRGFEISLRLGGVATNEIDTALQIALWKRRSSLGSDCVQAASSERFRSRSRIAVHQGYIPAAERDHSVRVYVSRQTLERGFNRSCAAFSLLSGGNFLCNRVLPYWGPSAR